jgi:hypothetical protein
MSFITLNGLPTKNIFRMVSLYEVYKAKCGLKLFRITHVDEIIHNGLIIPVVAHEEVLPHPKEYCHLNGVYISIENSTKIETEDTFMRDKNLLDINCYPILYSCGRCH